MKAKPAPKPKDVELIPDAWERFTEFVKRIAKAGPQHRVKKPDEPAPGKPRRGRPKEGVKRVDG
jgi:hypothetical protein